MCIFFLQVLRGFEAVKARSLGKRDEDEALRGYLAKHLEWRSDFYEEDARKDQVRRGTVFAEETQTLIKQHSHTTLKA